MKLKKTLACLLAAAQVFTLAACNQSNGPTPSGTKEPSKTNAPSGTNAPSSSKTTEATTGAPVDSKNPIIGDDVTIPEGLTLKYITNRTDRVDDGYLKEIVKPFEEKYKCTIEFEAIKKYNGDMQTRMPTGKYGDVLMMPSVTKDEYSKFFVPLGTVDELAKYYNWADNSAYEKVVYGLPHMGSITSGIVYNKKVWADAGITTLPKTPEEFIADLKQIKEKCTDVIPYYTNFHDTFAAKEWEHLPLSVSGNPNFKNEALINKIDIVGEDSPYYKIYDLLFKIVSDPTLREEDPVSSDWEASKPMLAQGKIGAMALGSWAVKQIIELAQKPENGGHPENVGYMPAPFNTDGKQYAESGADMSMCINKNIDEDHQNLAKKFIQWFVSTDCPFTEHEGGVGTIKEGGYFPDYLEDFSECELFVAVPAPDEIATCWDDINKESEVLFDEDSADRFVLKIEEAAIEAARNGDIAGGEAKFKQILDNVNKKWAEARDDNDALNDYISKLNG